MNHYRSAVDWRENAVCRKEDDPEIFFASDSTGPGKKDIAKAQGVCRRCPSRAECLTDAYTQDDEWGVRGGLTPRTRLHYLRKHNGDIDRAVADAIGDVRLLLRRIYRQHTERADGGHVVWTDQRVQVQVRGKPYTVLQIAWWSAYGTAPTGSVTRACDRDGCVARECLADLEMRQRAAAARRAAG